jgi:3-oxoacyl-(acyl-carrier-protein) synthase
LFPETVYAAPASHIAALLENVTLVTSLVGDPSSFLQGVALATQWLGEDRVDACVVIGAEETNWITADALWHLDRAASISAGAGALCLCREAGLSLGIELAAITDAHTYSAKENRLAAARAMRQQLNSSHGNSELLCDGVGSGSRTSAPETAAWRDWTGPRLSPKRVLGEGLMAAAAWQCVAACDAIANQRAKAANVSLVGFNQQAIGATFQSLSFPQ